MLRLFSYAESAEDDSQKIIGGDLSGNLSELILREPELLCSELRRNARAGILLS